MKVATKMLANDLVRLLHRVGEGQIILLGEAEDVPIEVLADLAQRKFLVAPCLQQRCRQCGLGVLLLEIGQGVGGPEADHRSRSHELRVALAEVVLDVPRRRT